MAIAPQQIQERLKQEQYQKFVVADIGNFPHCLAQTPEGIASGQRYQKYSTNPLSRTPPFSQWGVPQLLTPKSAQEYIKFAQQRNKKSSFKIDGEAVRVSECSNFAYHAAGILLDDPQIKAQYDVAVIGSMHSNGRYLHNITLLVPKGSRLPQPPQQLTAEVFPTGTLIVDPWAVGMGHPPEQALAVPKEQFAYNRSLFPATVNYQSALDESLTSTRTGQLTPYTGTPSRTGRQEVRTESQFPDTRSPVSATIPGNFAAYHELWRIAFQEIMNDPRHQLHRNDLEYKKIHAIRTVLDDYTKGGDTWWAKFRRIFTFHWNRHHVKVVDDIVKEIDAGNYTTSRALVDRLDNLAISLGSKLNPKGTLKEQIGFIKIQEQNPVEETENLSRPNLT
ncbi:Uncharacterised protein [Legionella pneumophila]|uniref:DUF5617 domain-containing protein n=1 Tax=Legionella pneumophila subsp. pneumophila TaxID=91891 RepID=A0AAV2UVW9_LEGPN|nr:Dot/Icm T4SS effector RavJ [Legionella pneumophila]MCK1848801.1 Dot/Icm T4SS effector RavJ [Legionella pneumophila]MDI9851951.1 Dot/Icm T4SS effector RavJ [Legionella pneumophila]MDW8865451.1 Dot/Icm T4SS effector RavJ [Legionella pneumophila]MDW8968100.1 Dot/Icm T4SS effector RavJ [Legionella pneumophila]MDW9136082.1 Dot/Icm T4SS effector RavJ [Legionella pneumophila]